MVSDSTLNYVYILAPTAFGQAVLAGNDEYYNGKWDAALEYFEEALKLNANYEAAYTGIGKNYLMKEDYKTAMYYFKMGNNRDFYSQAYEGYRAEVLEQNFVLIALIFVAIVVAVLASEVRYHSQGRKQKKETQRKIEQLRGRDKA